MWRFIYHIQIVVHQCLQWRLIVSNCSGIIVTDATPFRRFLGGRLYASKEELSQDVGKEKHVDEFCKWVLDLRGDKLCRNSIGDLIQQDDN